MDLSNSLLYTIVGAITGVILIILVSIFIPKIIAGITPRINEEKELIRGNRAVGDYYGRVVAAVIIGISIVIAAAIIAGIHG